MSMKQAYVEKIQARLNSWDAQIEVLKAEAAEATAGAKIEYEREVRELLEQQKQAQAKLDELRESSEDAWTELRAGAESAWMSLENAVRDATSRLVA